MDDLIFVNSSDQSESKPKQSRQTLADGSDSSSEEEDDDEAIEVEIEEAIGLDMCKLILLIIL